MLMDNFIVLFDDDKGGLRNLESILNIAKTVKLFPEPKVIRQVQTFLDLIGYFRKFISKYTTIARPLSDLLRANVKFCFGVTQEMRLYNYYTTYTKALKQ